MSSISSPFDTSTKKLYSNDNTTRKNQRRLRQQRRTRQRQEGNKSIRLHLSTLSLLLLYVVIFLGPFVSASSSTTTSDSSSTNSSKPTSIPSKPSFVKRLKKPFSLFSFRRSNKSKSKSKQEEMGQAVRVLQYDRAANEQNAISALKFSDQPLQWHRLDDGVMGGRSETIHHTGGGDDDDDDTNKKEGDGSKILHFEGTINTDGGGFCSIRTPIPDGLPEGTTGIRIRFRGDGKTYKLTLSDGNKSMFGPSKRSPSWQADVATKVKTNDDADDDFETVIIPLTSLVPSWGGGPGSQPTPEERQAAKLDISSIRQLGVMLSLKLSDGSPNPEETFGKGIFPFSLQILSIEPVVEANK